MIWYCTRYVSCPDFFSFVVVVFECISSNIVKRDMALSSDEVRIVFFWVHVKLVLPKFQAAPCSPEISSRALLCRNFKLAPLSIVLRNSCLLNPRLVTPKYLRYIIVSLCSDNSLHLNPHLSIPKLQCVRKLPPHVKS